MVDRVHRLLDTMVEAHCVRDKGTNASQWLIEVTTCWTRWLKPTVYETGTNASQWLIQFTIYSTLVETHCVRDKGTNASQWLIELTTYSTLRFRYTARDKGINARQWLIVSDWLRVCSIRIVKLPSAIVSNKWSGKPPSAVVESAPSPFVLSLGMHATTMVGVLPNVF